MADSNDAGRPNIVFATTIVPDKPFPNDKDTFSVQWAAFNSSQVDSPAFTDLLIITKIPEGCPGSDDQDHPVVYNSETDGNPQDFLEQPLAAGQEGGLMQPMVGPLPAGSYRLTVTLAKDLSNTTNWNCIDIEASS